MSLLYSMAVSAECFKSALLLPLCYSAWLLRWNRAIQIQDIMLLVVLAW